MSHLLSWSHYYELLKIKDDIERSFYEKQTTIENGVLENYGDKKRQAYFKELH